MISLNFSMNASSLSASDLAFGELFLDLDILYNDFYMDWGGIKDDDYGILFFTV